MRLFKIFIAVLIIVLLGASLSQAAVRMYWATCRTGGGDCLDGIDGTGLVAGDSAIVMMDDGSSNARIYFYRGYTDSAAEVDPTTIRPNANAGTFTWHLASIYGQNFNSVGSDGTYGVKFLNNTTAWSLSAGEYGFGFAAGVAQIGVNGTKYSLLYGTTPNIGAATGTSLIVTGVIDGLATVEAANGKTIDKLSGYYIATGTSAFIVPTPGANGGNQYCFKQANNATNAITVIPVHTSGVMLEATDGTAYCTADDKLVSGGGKTDKICIVAIDATHYVTIASVGTWTCTAH